MPKRIDLNELLGLSDGNALKKYFEDAKTTLDAYDGALRATASNLKVLLDDVKIESIEDLEKLNGLIAKSNVLYDKAKTIQDDKIKLVNQEKEALKLLDDQKSKGNEVSKEEEKLIKRVNTLKEKEKTLDSAVYKEKLRIEAAIKSKNKEVKAEIQLERASIQAEEEALVAKRKLEDEIFKLQQRSSSQNRELEKEKLRLKDAEAARTREIKEELKFEKDLATSQDQSIGTIDRLNARNRVLASERKKLNLETEKGRKRLDEINKELDENNDKLTENIDAYGKQKRNIGAYNSGVKEGIEATGLFSRELSILSRIQIFVGGLFGRNAAAAAAQAGATRAASAASGGLSKAMKVLKIALISTGIGAIVVALGTMVAALASTQAGTDKMRRVLLPLKAVLEGLFGFIQDVGLKNLEKLEKAFENPQQAIKDLGQLILDNLINRFKALGVLGKAILKLLGGDFKQGFKELSDGVIQLGTGVENATDKLSDLGDEIAEIAKESYEAGERIAELTQRIEEFEIRSVVPIAKLKLKFEELGEIAKDQTIADQDRIDALNDQVDIQEKINNTEVTLIQLRLNKLKEEQALNDTSNEEQLEFENLRAELLNKRADAQKKINTLVAQRSAIEKRQNAEIQKALDDAEKKRREALSNFDDDTIDDSAYRRALDERAKAAAEATKEANAARQAELDEQEEQERLRLERIAEYRAEVTEASYAKVDSILEKYIGEQESRLDDTIAASKKREAELQKLADDRVLGAKESLAQQEKDRVVAERKKEQLQRRQKNIETGLASIKAFQAYIEGGKTVPEALTLSLLTGGFFESLFTGTAFDGEENTGGNNGGGLDGRGGMLYMAHPNEKILSKKQTDRIGITTPNDTIAEVMYNFRKGNLVPKGIKETKDVSPILLDRKIDELIQVAKNNAPPKTDFDRYGKHIHSRIKRGDKFINEHNNVTALW